MWLLNRYSELIEIITLFILSYPILSIYFMGSLIAFGIAYSLMSGGYLDPSHKKKTYIISAISSWIVVIGFLYGFSRGFIESLFEDNKGGH